MAGGFAVIALCVVTSMVAATSAGALSTWLAPTKLSAPGQNAEGSQVSVDEQGDALAGWQRFNEKSARFVIEVASRPAGTGSWQAPAIVSNTKDEASLPQVALDSSGGAVAAWLSFDGSEYSIRAATRPGLNGTWQAPVTIKKLGAMAVMEPRPDLAVDSRGDAVVVWQRMEGSEAILEAAGRPAGASSWQAPETVSEKAGAMHPAEVGIDAAGNATAVWEENVAGELLTGAASKPAGGKWQSPMHLSAPGGNANEPRVAVDAQGDAVAVWERFEGEEFVEAASKPASSGTWGKPVALTKPELGKGEPAGQQVGIGGLGNAVAVWSRMNGTHDFVEAAVGQASSAAWQPPATLSGPGANVEEQPQVAVNAAGSAVVVWERLNGGTEVVEAASGLAANGSWQAPVPLSASGGEAVEAQVALDAHGNAGAGWKRFDGKNYIAEAAGYDAAGPQLGSVVIPPSGTVGQSLAFSASPLDVWSALGATSWSFGDGTSQTGTSVVHAYGGPGTYTVTITGLDAVGNATSTSGRVSVASPPPSTKEASPRVAPRISAARVSPSRFRVSKRTTAVSAKAKAPQGTSFSFVLSEPAKLQVAFKRAAAGLRRGKRCVAPSAKLKRRHARRCTRLLTSGTLTRAKEPAGADRLAFSGRIGAKPLAPGPYKAILTASAGGLNSAAATLALAVVR